MKMTRLTWENAKYGAVFHNGTCGFIEFSTLFTEKEGPMWKKGSSHTPIVEGFWSLLAS